MLSGSSQRADPISAEMALNSFFHVYPLLLYLDGLLRVLFQMAFNIVLILQPLGGMLAITADLGFGLVLF